MAGFMRVSAVLVVAWILVVQVRGCLMTDEEHLRGLIAEATDGWNSGSASATVEPLADDFVLAPFRQGKPWLRGILFNIFMYNRDPETQDFIWEATVDWDSVELKFVDPEQTHAQIRGTVALVRSDGRTDGNYNGAFGVEAKKRDGDWEIVAAGLQGLGNYRGRTRAK